MNWFTTHDLLKRSGPFTMAPDYIIWYVLVAVAVGVGIFLLNKFKTEKRVKIVLITLWAVALGLDAVKLIVNIFNNFTLSSDLPLYICSLFWYAMPIAIWGKGKFKDIAAAYVCTISWFGAIGNYVVPSIVVDYSLFSFYGFHTTLYHTILLVTPLIMLCTGYTKLQWKNFIWQFYGFVLATLVIIPFDALTDTNYMYFNTGVTGIGFTEDIAATLGVAWPLFMYLVYAAIMVVMQGLIWGVTKLVEIINAKIKAAGRQPQVATISGAAETAAPAVENVEPVAEEKPAAKTTKAKTTKK